MNTKLVAIWYVTATLIMTACSAGNIPFLSTSTPTLTPTPTLTTTPLPTSTPLPTLTLTPSLTPVPRIGIDTPVFINDVSLQFTDASVSDSPVKTVYGRKVDWWRGVGILTVRATYGGDIRTLLEVTLIPPFRIYVADPNGTRHDYHDEEWNSDSHIVWIYFLVKPGASSFVLHNTVGKPWTVDLTPLLEPQQSAPQPQP